LDGFRACPDLRERVQFRARNKTPGQKNMEYAMIAQIRETVNAFFIAVGPVVLWAFFISVIWYTYVITVLMMSNRASLAIFFAICNPFLGILTGLVIGTFLRQHRKKK
jgi:uncharacterized membrane protein